LIAHTAVSLCAFNAIKDKPVVVNGQIIIQPIMVIALTYDHRLLDDREAVTFLGPYSLHYSMMTH
jgi:2-oxoglutarate dehydrogenase E2 component (dihydrolipoamide succinyltransferase)